MPFLQSFVQSIQQRQQVKGLVQSASALGQWFESPIGQRLLSCERRAIDKALNCLFGYHLMQLSVLPSAKLYQASRICHCCRVSFNPLALAEVASRFEALPFADDSVDVTLIHHALDFSENPHQLLSEVSRVTIAHGHIVIVGFDSLSLTGACKPFAQLAQLGPVWQRHSLQRTRINDWLKLLGFEPMDVYFGSCKTPVLNTPKPRWAARAKLPFGHFYCIVARKMMADIRPIKPAWDAHLLQGVKIAPRPLTARGAARLSLIRQHAKPIVKPQSD